MTKYTINKNFSAINESCGLIQNLSNDSNVEITDNTSQPGILLKPLQFFSFNQKIFARKIGNSGSAAVVVLPFDTVSSDTDSTVTDSTDDSGDFVVDCYDDFFSNQHDQPLSVSETPSHFIVRVSKDSLQHQNKFLIHFDDSKGSVTPRLKAGACS